MFSQLLLSVVNELIGFILELDNSLLCCVGLLSFLGFLDHSFNIGVSKTTGRLNCHILGFTSRFILGIDIHDTIGIDIEGNLNLRMSSGSHWDSNEFKISELLVVFSKLTLTLKDSNTDLGLVIGSSGEDLTLLSWDSGVSVN